MKESQPKKSRGKIAKEKNLEESPEKSQGGYLERIEKSHLKSEISSLKRSEVP